MPSALRYTILSAESWAGSGVLVRGLYPCTGFACAGRSALSTWCATNVVRILGVAGGCHGATAPRGRSRFGSTKPVPPTAWVASTTART